MKIAGLITKSFILGVIVLVVVEIALRAVQSSIRFKPMMFRTHQKLGWLPRPDLKITRANDDAEIIELRTNMKGFRSSPEWPQQAPRRLLVLGDSFAFGANVTLRERFDSVLERLVPGLKTVNLGVPGFGTDQEILAGVPYFNKLRAEDFVLLLTYGNDFFDITNKRFAGRPKPWYGLQNEELVFHPAKISNRDKLRNYSLLYASWVVSFTQHTEETFSATSTERTALYRKIVEQHALPLIDRGVSFIIAHHYDRVPTQKFDARSFFEEFCNLPLRCLALDKVLGEPDKQSPLFTSTFHWRTESHRMVAEAIAPVLLEQGTISLENVPFEHGKTE